MYLFDLFIFVKHKILIFFGYDENYITTREMEKITNDYLLHYENEEYFTRKNDDDLIIVR